MPISDGKPAPQVHAHGCTRCWWRHGAQSRSPRQAPHRAAAGARGRHTAGPGRTACCSHTASGNARAAGPSACASSGSRRWWPAGCTCGGVRRLRGQQPHLPTAGVWGHLAPTDLMVWSLCRMTSWICRSTVTLVSSSSCFCVLASATHVRYVAMASSAWDRAEGCKPHAETQSAEGGGFPGRKHSLGKGPEVTATMGLHPLLSPPHVPSPCSWLLPLGAAACPGPWRPCHPPQAQCPPALPPLWPPGGEPCRGPHSAARSPAWPCEGWTLPLAAGVGVGRLVPSCPLTGLSVPAFPFLPTLTARHQGRDLPPTSRAEISWPSRQANRPLPKH